MNYSSGQPVKVIREGTMLYGEVGEVVEDKGQEGDEDAGVLVRFLHPIGYAKTTDPEPHLFWHDEIEAVNICPECMNEYKTPYGLKAHRDEMRALREAPPTRPPGLGREKVEEVIDHWPKED